MLQLCLCYLYLSSLQSESASDSLVANFCYKPLDEDIDWSMVAKASPCYVTVRFPVLSSCSFVSMYGFEMVLCFASVFEGFYRSNH